MATFSAPPEHPSHAEVLILSALVDYQLTVAAPDPDLEGPCLTTASGEKITSTAAIARFVAGAGTSGDLYPQGGPEQAEVDKWLAVAAELEARSGSWTGPRTSQADDQARAADRAAVEAQLAQLEGRLAGDGGGAAPARLAGGAALSAADVAVACALLPLLQRTLGAEARAAYPATCEWAAALAATAPFSTVVGEVRLCAASGGWTAPAPTAPAEVDPEKAAKKAAKAAEKEAKKAKALARVAAAAAAAADPKAGGNDKKAKAKAEAEAKKAAEAAEVADMLAAARSIPKGAKPPPNRPVPKAYHPKIVEAGWYEWWEAQGYFRGDVESDKPPFVIVIPPPNVTGALHIGHALTNAVEDTIVRWRRMSGYNALWVPGTDHAGISTQTVVEKKLAKDEGLTRHDIGREEFLKRVFTWVDEYGGKINNQLRRIGSSVDWSRYAFTLDDTRSAAVLEAFVRMYEQGVIYRDNRLVNWDCALTTAVSDIEVEYIDIPGRTLLSVPGWGRPVEFGVLTSFAYPLEGGEGEIVVATTRPETMLGDTAVAVHPEDPRYKALIGRNVVHPVSGRLIPIVADAELVDMSFGTGAVKITPAHDPNDFQVGKRHGLAFINILEDGGTINAEGGPFQGQHRFQARVTVVDFLKERGLFRGTADNAMRLGLSDRSKDVIEPVLKPQWWVRCGDMAARSCVAVRSGDLQIVPKEFEVVWFRWLENIRDWCISRQLWWGHRIPAFYVTFQGEAPEQAGRPGAPSEDPTRWVVGRTADEARAAAAARFPGREFTLTQDEDVLDTWFSSGLFPFSVFGWPQETPELAKFYPGALLETGHDILFFWVARMVMMGLQLTGRVPFGTVYLHAMVRDAHGRKMSKTLGNVVDPLHVIEGISLQGLHDTLTKGNLDPKEVAKAVAGQKSDFPDGIEECGTDALRFALVAYTTQARDINLDIKRVVGYRHWCNKLWNAIRFAMLNLPEDFKPATAPEVAGWPSACRWMVSRLNAAVSAVIQAMEVYDFGAATTAIYALWQYEVCDVFIELVKPVMAADATQPGVAAEQEAFRQALWLALDQGLALLHPFMPFVTEELWQRLPKRADQESIPSIMLAPYPAPNPAWADPTAEGDMAALQRAVTAARSLRADYNLNRQRPQLLVSCTDARLGGALAALAREAATLALAGSVEVLPPGAPAPVGCSVRIVDDTTTVHMVLQGLLDPAVELQRLDKKLADVNSRLDALRRKMAMPSYAEKTPEAILAEDAERLERLDTEARAVEQAMADMRALAEQQQAAP